MTWRTCASHSYSSARSAYSTRAVGSRPPADDQTEIGRRVGVVAQLAQAAGELGGGPEGRHPIAADQSGDRGMVDTRLLRQLALRHLLGLELGPQPFVEGSAVLGRHAGCQAPWRSGHDDRDDPHYRRHGIAPVSPVRTRPVTTCAIRSGLVRCRCVRSAAPTGPSGGPRQAAGTTSAAATGTVVLGSGLEARRPAGSARST